MEELRKTMKNFGHDFNPGLSEYEVEVLTTTLRPSGRLVTEEMLL
jgi:hypothetical protein